MIVLFAVIDMMCDKSNQCLFLLAVADAAMAQTVYTAEADSALQQEIQYDVITLGE